LRSILRLVSSALVVIGIARSLSAQNVDDIRRWERQAQNVTIIRDDWGIAHVYGKTDADAVFGMEYAQAEDDFNRIETNYLNSLGRLAEAEGEAAVFQDLRQKLFVDPDSLRAQYARSPAWLKRLMDAFADGLNFFLYKHPEVKPRVITRFEPWMALSFTEGSIGGDIERISVRDLTALYGDSATATPGPRTQDDEFETDPAGSNGIAIAPRLTANRRALLWINPHTSFFFRSELQMVSEEGLNAYGAATWGQFFIYQGFNGTAGWMHTSSGVDNIDEFYEARATSTRKITVPFKTGQRTFTVQYTPRGPIVRKEGDRLVSVSLMWQPINALIQSYSRTKARNLAEFRKIMELHTNSSNNTVFADAEGNIAYFHSNYIPRRDTSFDWTRPVDGGNPATSYKGVLRFDETPNVVNPASGWVYNANNWPWSAAGDGASPSRARYPRYVETSVEETARGYHALRVLVGKANWTMNTLRDAAFDSYLPAFERMIPPLLAAYDQAPPAPAGDSLKSKLAEPIAILRAWDYRWSSESVPTALAVFWGGSIGRRVARDARAAGISVMQYIATSRARPADLLGSLAGAVDTLNANFGTWKTTWGTINRFQRISPEIAARFDDAQPSIPVPFTASVWGSLAAFGSRPYANTKKWYGTSGNSFVAVVEFGDSVRAKAVTAGGESGSPRSPHFNDQAERYASGDLRDVYFYRSQLAGHSEREYHPGERPSSR
jgi:acyl-homoserine-lactone acylase